MLVTILLVIALVCALLALFSVPAKVNWAALSAALICVALLAKGWVG
jgi:hypothetical protein